MKGIMYHYVRPRDKNFPNLHRLDFESFKKQLDFFDSEYGFINKYDFINCIKNEKKIKGVILTFDDALSCHYDFAFNELKKRGLWGIFYVPTSPLKSNKILDVHRIHIILSNANIKQVYNYLIQNQFNDLFDEYKIEEFKELTYLTQKNDEYSLSIKRILNYFIKYQHREDVIDKLFKLFIKEDYTSEDYYLSIDNLKEMKSNGMIIGSHTENHMVMSKISEDVQREEIINSFNFLKNELGEQEIKTFCYPYGGFHTFTERTEELLCDNGCDFSFNVEQRDINVNDLKNRIQALPRFDCNQFKYGEPSVD